MRHDLGDDGTIIRTDTRPPSLTNANNNVEIEIHPGQPGDANDCDKATDTGSVSHAVNASEAPEQECSETNDETISNASSCGKSYRTMCRAVGRMWNAENDIRPWDAMSQVPSWASQSHEDADEEWYNESDGDKL